MPTPNLSAFQLFPFFRAKQIFCATASRNGAIDSRFRHVAQLYFPALPTNLKFNCLEKTISTRCLFRNFTLSKIMEASNNVKLLFLQKRIIKNYFLYMERTDLLKY